MALPLNTQTFSPDYFGRSELHPEDLLTPLVTLSTCPVTHLFAILNIYLFILGHVQTETERDNGIVPFFSLVGCYHVLMSLH